MDIPANPDNKIDESDYNGGWLKEKPAGEKEDLPKLAKHHRIRNFLIVLIFILFFLSVGLAITGLYNIPLISSVFGTNQPKDLGIKTNPQDLISLEKKIPMTISGDPVDYSLRGDQIFIGKIKVDTQTTSQEITAWLNRFKGEKSPVADIQVKMIEGGLEISAMLNKYVKAPIYAKVMVTRISTNSISLDLKKANLGIFPVPNYYLKKVEDWFEQKINERMIDLPGFSMEKLEYHTGYSIFQGTWPKNVKPNPLGFSALILE